MKITCKNLNYSRIAEEITWKLGFMWESNIEVTYFRRKTSRKETALDTLV
jgi:hypothetical protein